MAQNRHKLAGEYMYDGMAMSSVIFPREILDHIKNNFELYDDDVVITTYPKAGTTWFQEIAWLILNDGDVEKANAVLQDIRVPFLEVDTGKKPRPIDLLEGMASPRIFKSHLPYRFFSKQLKTKKTKVVLGARNIKDTLVSMYHFYRMNDAFGRMTGPFEEFFELFKEKHLAYGDWFEFNLDYWNNRDQFNLFVLKYEDLKKDPMATIRKLAAFLGKEVSDEQLSTICEHVSFDEMRGNKSVNKHNFPGFNHDISPFMRRGQVGDWKNHLTQEQNEYINKLYDQEMKGTGLDFDFEI